MGAALINDWMDMTTDTPETRKRCSSQANSYSGLVGHMYIAIGTSQGYFQLQGHFASYQGCDYRKTGHSRGTLLHISNLGRV